MRRWSLEAGCGELAAEARGSSAGAWRRAAASSGTWILEAALDLGAERQRRALRARLRRRAHGALLRAVPSGGDRKWMEAGRRLVWRVKIEMMLVFQSFRICTTV